MKAPTLPAAVCGVQQYEYYYDRLLIFREAA